MNINATLFAQLLVFFILAFVTMKFIWPPLIQALDERNKKIADGLQAAKKGEQILIDAETEARKILRQAQVCVQKKIKNAEEQAKITEEKILTTAKFEAKKIILKAESEIAEQMRLARDTLHQDIVELVIAGTEKILSREIDKSHHASLLLELKNEL